MSIRFQQRYGLWVEYIVPPGCTSRTNTYRFYTTQRRTIVSNARESRTYPANPIQSQTGQAEQVTRTTNSLHHVHYLSEIACSHDGSHPPTKVLLHDNAITIDSPWSLDLHSKDLWSQRAREDMEAKTVNLGTTLAEYRASARMFGSFATGMKRAYDVSRGRFKRKKLRACSIPAAHLQYSYGIGPLASDLFGAAEALLLKLDQPLIVRNSSFNKESISDTIYFGDRVYKFSSRKSQRSIIYAEVEPRHTGIITFGNPAEWAWELIPFSFVVDWGIPIGEWIHSLDALNGVSNINGTVTTKMEYNHTELQDTGILVSPGNLTHSSHSREKVTSIPIPPLPKWEPSKSFRTAANALALLWGMSKTCRK